MSKNGWRGLSVFALGACAVAALSQAIPNQDVKERQLSMSTALHVATLGVATPIPSQPLASATTVSSDVAGGDDSDDPFAPRGWQAETTPTVSDAAPVVVPVAALPNEMPTVTPVPVLPFTFMGRMSDGALAMVYISRGEESWTVKGGEMLDGNYKVVSVNPQQIVFEHLPTGTQQILALPEPDK